MSYANVAVTTVAGSGTAGWDVGPALKAEFDTPMGLAVDSYGAIYVADAENSQIKMIKDGIVTALNGDGLAYGYKDGPKSLAQLDTPAGVAVGSEGSIYIADTDNHCIRAIRGDQVVTVCGKGRERGDKVGPLQDARFEYPSAIAIHTPSDTIFVADKHNNNIKVIKGEYVTRLGDAPCHFSKPVGVAVTDSGTVYVAESGKHCITMFEDGKASVIAGDNGRGYRDGQAKFAQFGTLAGIVADDTGTIYVADVGNGCIRVISNGVVSTIGRPNPEGLPAVDGNASEALFRSPYGLALDKDGNLYVSDMKDDKIRKISLGKLARQIGSSIDLSGCLKKPIVGFDVTINIGGTNYELHSAFLRLRCPHLLELNLASAPIKPASSSIFITYLYSSRLPEKATCTDWLCVAYLLQKCGFLPDSRISLAKFDLTAVKSAVSEGGEFGATLISLYGLALSLELFPQGISSCKRMLKKFASILPLDKLADMLPDFPQAAAELQAFLPSEQRETKSTGRGRKSLDTETPQTRSIERTLERLRKKPTGADFEIAFPDGPKVKGHSFILNERWPYFRLMLESGLNESKSKCLKLPAPTEPGALSPLGLKAVLDFVYLGQLSPKLEFEFDLVEKINLVSAGGLYLDGDLDAPDPQKPNIFKPLLEWCLARIKWDLNEKNCVEVFKAGLCAGAETVAALARGVIVQLFDRIWKDPVQKKLIMSLPDDVRSELMFDCIARIYENKR